MRKTSPLTNAAVEDIRRADEALATKIEAYKTLLDPPRRKAERLRWAKAQAETGAQLHDFAMFSYIEGAEAHFLSAAALLEAALEIVTPKSDLAEWVRIQMELGEVWENSSRGAGATAIAARRRSAEIHKEILAALEGRKPRLRARVWGHLGGVLHRLGGIEAGPEAREALLASAQAYEAALALEEPGKPRVWLWRWLSRSRHGLRRHAGGEEEARSWLRSAVAAMEGALAALEPAGRERSSFGDQASWEEALTAGRGGKNAPLLWGRFQAVQGDLLRELAALEGNAASQETLRRAASAYEAALSLSAAQRSGGGWNEVRAKLDEAKARLALGEGGRPEG